MRPSKSAARAPFTRGARPKVRCRRSGRAGSGGHRAGAPGSVADREYVGRDVRRADGRRLPQGQQLAVHWPRSDRARRPRGQGNAWFALERLNDDPIEIVASRMEVLGPVTERELEIPGAERASRAREPGSHSARPVLVQSRAAVVRSAAARAHPPLHAQPPACRDRTGVGGGLHALPAPLAARGRRGPGEGR